MKPLDFIRCALICCVAAAMLAGCGGSQPPIGVAGAMPQTSALATHAGRGKSWMLPGTSSGDLLYAVGGCGGTCVLSLSTKNVVGALNAGEYAVCADTRGNIFLTSSGKVIEYAHGGTTPIATLSLPGDIAGGCAVDPLTNNLAVTIFYPKADIAIFPNETGTPSLYASGIAAYYCGYDYAGNLFANGSIGFAPALAELPTGASKFINLSVNKRVGANPGELQWDGQHMTYERAGQNPKISQLKIEGTKASIISDTPLNKIKRGAFQSWIYGNEIFVPYAQNRGEATKLGVWNYPEGGKPVQTFDFGSYDKTLNLQGVAISVAPSR